MNRKQKIFLGMFLLLLVAPIAGTMLLSGQTNVVDNNSIEIEKRYGISANPVVGADTLVTNLDDTDNLYGGAYRSYILVVNCSDADGSSDIANITVSFGGYFSFRWMNTTGLVTTVNGSTYATLGTATNTTTSAGLTLNLTIAFEVEWAMVDTDDVDISYQIYDDPGTLVKGTLNVNYDFDTDLVMTPTSFVSLVSTQTNDPVAIASTSISYEDSGGDNYPLAAETDFLLVRTPATGSGDSWSEASYSDATGVATWATVTAGYIAQTETYTMYTYTQGSTTTNLFGASYTDSVEITNSGGAVQEPITEGIPAEYIFAAGMIVMFLWYYNSKNKKSPKKRSGRKK